MVGDAVLVFFEDVGEDFGVWTFGSALYYAGGGEVLEVTIYILLFHFI